MLLKVDNIALGYNAPQVVLSASLAVDQGQIVAVLGANGCGKSTLVKAIARKLKPLSGKIELDGQDIWSMDNARYAAKVAYVPQSISIPDDMTVSELTGLGRNPHQRWWQQGLGPGDRIVVEETLALLDLTALADRRVGLLSGGERQRAVLSMALSQLPKLLILDEPTAGLDFRHQLELLETLQMLKTSGLAVITVLHDLALASRYADRVVLLEKSEGKGKILDEGKPVNILNAENLARIYGVRADLHTTGGGNTLFDLIEPIK